MSKITVKLRLFEKASKVKLKLEKLVIKKLKIIEVKLRLFFSDYFSIN